MMENASSLNVLLVAEGSGGHLIPALQVAAALAKSGQRVKVWYANRPNTAPLLQALAHAQTQATYDVSAMATSEHATLWRRLWECKELYASSRRFFDASAPDVVVGFGGWFCAPIILAARKQQISCLLHEQNVSLGRANRLLARLVDRVAVSFPETRYRLNGTQSLVTGLPVREAIGRGERNAAASKFGVEAKRPTLLVLGGSQGARAVNQLVIDLIAQLSAKERAQWQWLHITGLNDEGRIRRAYMRGGLTAWVAPYLVQMEQAYALADVVIARAGASTIMELARCGKPAVLIPYPYAGGHQRLNARLVEAVGGAVVIEEGKSAARRLGGVVRHLLLDVRLRTMMGNQVRQLAMPDATARLTKAILELRSFVAHPGSST